MFPTAVQAGVRVASAPLIALSLLFVGDAVNAGEFAYGFGYLGEYSSNIDRTQNNERSEWIDSLIAGIAYNDQTPGFQTRLQAIGEYRDYRKDTFDDESLLTFNGLAVWSPYPQQLTWTAEDVYTQATLNPAAPDTPDNRAAANVFSTGPDAYLRFGPADTLQLGLRYGTVYYGDSDADNENYTGYARWLHLLSPTTTASLNYEYYEVNYEVPTLYPDYVQRDAFLGLVQRLPNSVLTAEAGVTRIRMEETGEEFDGNRYALSWVVRTGSDSAAGISYRSEYSNSAADLLDASGDVTTPPAIPTDPSPLDIAISGDFYYVKEAQAFYNYTGPPLGWRITLFQRDLDYEVILADEKERGGRLEISLAASTNFIVTLFAEKAKSEFVQPVVEDNETDVGIHFAYRYTRNILMGLTFNRVTLDSTDPTREFIDNRALLSVLYTSTPTFNILSQ